MSVYDIYIHYFKIEGNILDLVAQKRSLTSNKYGFYVLCKTLKKNINYCKP